MFDSVNNLFPDSMFAESILVEEFVFNRKIDLEIFYLEYYEEVVNNLRTKTWFHRYWYFIDFADLPGLFSWVWCYQWWILPQLVVLLFEFTFASHHFLEKYTILSINLLVFFWIMVNLQYRICFFLCLFSRKENLGGGLLSSLDLVDNKATISLLLDYLMVFFSKYLDEGFHISC